MQCVGFSSCRKTKINRRFFSSFSNFEKQLGKQNKHVLIIINFPVNFETFRNEKAAMLFQTLFGTFLDAGNRVVRSYATKFHANVLKSTEASTGRNYNKYCEV